MPGHRCRYVEYKLAPVTWMCSKVYHTGREHECVEYSYFLTVMDPTHSGF